TVDTLSSLDYRLNVERFVEDLEIPWAIDFIDAGTALVTERPGRLRIVERGTLLPQPVAGTPEVLHQGQGGLLDVAIDPDFSESGWGSLPHSRPIDQAGGDRPLAITRLVRGRIQDHQWVDEQVIFEAPHETYLSTRHHYGSRIVFDEN